MRYLFMLFSFIVFTACNTKARVTKITQKQNDDRLINIFDFHLHKYSAKIYKLNIDANRNFNDSIFTGTFCEVYDLSLEDKKFIVQQCLRQGYTNLPIKDIEFPFLNNYLHQQDTGYYLNKHVGGEFFGLDRFLIVNLTKKYFIWFQDK